MNPKLSFTSYLDFKERMRPDVLVDPLVGVNSNCSKKQLFFPKVSGAFNATFPPLVVSRRCSRRYVMRKECSMPRAPRGQARISQNFKKIKYFTRILYTLNYLRRHPLKLCDKTSKIEKEK